MPRRFPHQRAAAVANRLRTIPAAVQRRSKKAKPSNWLVTISDIVAEDLPDWINDNEILYSSCVAGAISEAEYIDGLRQAGLVDIEVRDRLVYDTSMLKGLVESELADADSSIADWIESIGPQKAAELIQQVEGKIASISIYARKPISD